MLQLFIITKVGKYDIVKNNVTKSVNTIFTKTV